MKVYRPEIDGLRAISVIAVILYHAEFTVAGHTLLRGGYIGVDVFFVISGFLISQILLTEIEATGRIDFLKFYARRARRILPALLAVIFATIPFAYYLLLPSELLDYANSIGSTLLFGSNFYFYFTATQYGEPNTLLKPFLHTWSLSVEEQFYIGFPLLLLITRRYLKSRVLPCVSLVASLSFVLCVVTVRYDQQQAFYSPLTRTWELLAGTLLAYHQVRRGRIRPRPLLAAAGLVLVVGSLILFRKDTVHPGVLTVIPVIGTCLVLAFAGHQDAVGRLLASRPAALTGLVSYSLYLWHYPIFAFLRLTSLNLNNGDKFLAIAATVLVAVVNFVIIEKPLRHTRRSRALWITLSSSVATITAAVVSAISMAGFPHRLDQIYPPLAQANEARLESTFLSLNNNIQAAKPIIFIIGDSHARNWSIALKNHIDTDRYQVVAVSYLNCMVEIKNDIVRAPSRASIYDKYCIPFEKFINDKTLLNRTKAIFLTSLRPFEYTVNPFRFELLSWMKSHSDDARIFVFGNYFQLDELHSCLGLMFQRKSDASICLREATYPPANQPLEQLPFFPSNLAFTYVDIVKLHCDYDKEKCLTSSRGVPFITDWNHLTAEFLTTLIGDILEKRTADLRGDGLLDFLVPPHARQSERTASSQPNAGRTSSASP
ncbi:acyltransferase [Rhizobium laguerreae]|uniref:Acyltransferase n=1 Tax=Rhizobium laguerreae TaxID=1076926 RepID=A0AB35F8T0_9HYPH|nr:acyltransferase family protein [Rhizobium laguerreae]MBY3061941.1 acyltransferase [Rhizobium laguerreae]MBY3077678.1 acyltransferase [Rhizobium laguerreae]MBY3110772.1 acyltransferase [Rhizobium laguerreae]MBY3242231.1 acyltransferase [Rhizobium laguerreae]MBY3301707.1 acyltransferase [Rhizobium laguerreae]